MYACTCVISEYVCICIQVAVMGSVSAIHKQQIWRKRNGGTEFVVYSDLQIATSVCLLYLSSSLMSHFPCRSADWKLAPARYFCLAKAWEWLSKIGELSNAPMEWIYSRFMVQCKAGNPHFGPYMNTTQRKSSPDSQELYLYVLYTGYITFCWRAKSVKSLLNHQSAMVDCLAWNQTRKTSCASANPLEQALNNELRWAELIVSQ